ncbi:MAG: hypothetical protein WCR72_14140 [Bacteroidota bacterium]
MRNLIILLCSIFCVMQSFAQNTAGQAAQVPFSSAEDNSNYYVYIGSGGKQNKANTEIMYKKMKEIYALFDEAFKNSKGISGSWRALVDDISNEGLVKGKLEITLTAVYRESNGELNKKGGPQLRFSVLINGFEPYVIRDKKKASGFTEKNGQDFIDGHLIYVISEKQQEESFKGFPLYYTGWNKTPEQSCVIITKPDVPLFKPITVGEFLELYKNWIAEYNLQKPNDKYNVSAERIEKFINTYKSGNNEFYNEPCITIWDRSEQIPYVRRDTYVDDATMGNPWVTFNPSYINKDATAASVQFITIEWFIQDDATISSAFKDFKNNFDFKKLQAMLGK